MFTLLRNLDWSVLTDMILSIIPALICIVFHELSHGFVAYKLGDTTAKEMGRLTLNPLKHIDVLGLIMMAVFHFGWAKPVPVNMYRFKNPKRGMAITALAGPVSNIIIAVVFMALYGFFWPLLYMSEFGAVILDMLNTTAVISISFAIFNIIPIPPLDGSKILFSFVPQHIYKNLMRYERFGMIILIALIYLGTIDGFLNKTVMFVYEKLFIIVQGANALANIIF